MPHPYLSQPDRAFWRKGIVQDARGLVKDIYDPKFTISPATGVATAGSCFAQHIGRALRGANCRVLDAEPAPGGMHPKLAAQFGFGQFSARYGNIYTARQLRELLEEAQRDNPDPRLVWEKDGRFYDALRPTVEPHGHQLAEHVLTHRRFHLARLREMLAKTEVFIFTLGLTEAWIDRLVDRVLPVCPGVKVGEFDPQRHVLHHITTQDLILEINRINALLRQFQPQMQMILTVSPVPLNATAGQDHVVTATSHSKAILRAAAGDVARNDPNTDYFPSYELITTPVAGGPWFASDLRQIHSQGVDIVMAHFFEAHGLHASLPSEPANETTEFTDDEASCDDVLLASFAR